MKGLDARVFSHASFRNDERTNLEPVDFLVRTELSVFHQRSFYVFRARFLDAGRVRFQWAKMFKGGTGEVEGA